ncbi:e9imm peptide [Brevibacillus laterosporus]|uniref:e9imm peptide n=1 Tax=Brevibacillus laterosporus TaxID=1465 RepID=UPI001C3EDF24|nr:e9imm peptide [Brevibacillus laterosporus]
MQEDRIRQLVKDITDQKFLLEPTEELIVELQSMVSFPDVEDLFYTDHGYQYISNRLIDYEKRQKNNLSKQELINMVNRILDVDGEEYEIDNLLLILRIAVNDPDVTDYIYYSDEDLTAEQIVEKALSNKPTNND